MAPSADELRTVTCNVSGSGSPERPGTVAALPPVSFKRSPAIRAADVVLASLFCLPALPLMALVALLIKILDGGPVFFLQERAGLGMKRISIIKFRTMVKGAEKEEESILDQCGEPNVQLHQDLRITKLGATLRRLSLDELPQLLLVLTGRLSLVGPRPLIFAEVRRMPKQYLDRFRVMPGITGLAQVSGRAQLSVWDIMDKDLQWVREYSLAGYFRILLKTVSAVSRTKEAT